MNSEELGRRIKEARLAKNMTQSELVGTFITRNMLSRIESGNACPSVKTLEYLAQRLELPAGSLMADNEPESEEASRDAQLLLKSKKLYIAENYESAGEAARELIGGEFSDEAQAMLARSFLALSDRAMQNGDTAAAAKFAKEALSYADKGIYKSREVAVDASIRLSEIAEGK